MRFFITALATLALTATAAPTDLVARTVKPLPAPPAGYSRIANFCTNPDALTCCTQVLAGVGSALPTAAALNCQPAKVNGDRGILFGYCPQEAATTYSPLCCAALLASGMYVGCTLPTQVSIPEQCF